MYPVILSVGGVFIPSRRMPSPPQPARVVRSRPIAAGYPAQLVDVPVAPAPVLRYSPIRSPEFTARPVLTMSSPALGSRTVQDENVPPRHSLVGRRDLLSPPLPYRVMPVAAFPAYQGGRVNQAESGYATCGYFSGLSSSSLPRFVIELHGEVPAEVATKRQTQNLLRQFLHVLSKYFCQMDSMWVVCFERGPAAVFTMKEFFEGIDTRLSQVVPQPFSLITPVALKDLFWYKNEAIQKEIFYGLCLCNRQRARPHKMNKTLPTTIDRDTFMAAIQYVPFNCPHFPLPMQMLNKTKVFQMHEVEQRIVAKLKLEADLLPDYNMSDVITSEEIQIVLGGPYVTKGVIEAAVQNLIKDENRAAAFPIRKLMQAVEKYKAP